MSASTQILDMFSGGTRYQAEKIAIAVIYLVICVSTIVWFLSGRSVDNPLGADASFERVGPLESPTFFLENKSGDDWTNVRIAVDKQYLYTVAEIKENETVTLRPEDFRYYFFIPRPWGRSDWETLATVPKAGRFATNTLAPKLMEIRADQGKHDVTFSGSPVKK